MSAYEVHEPMQTNPAATVQVAGRRPSRDFRCPRCGGELSDAAEALDCVACDKRFPRREGIVDFRLARHDYYFNPVPRAEMADLVRQAGAVPWDATIRRFLRFVKNVPDWVDNLAVDGRYAWKLFLDMPASGRFLDLGCGLGNLTHNVAPHVAEVVALDLTWERLQFARQRFAQFNATDRITVVAGGDGERLPFPDQHFDVVALSGVLEWIGDDFDVRGVEGSRLVKAAKMLAPFFGARNPRRVQLRFLRELRRVLKPDGQLFVAIENRWGYEYFKGRSDHHSGLRFGSLLPRLLANAYSIAYKRRPYRTYTYSRPGARRLFSAAGFPVQRFLGLTPGYSKLREVIPFDFDRELWSMRPAPTVKESVKRSAHFVPAFGIVADGASRERPALIERLLEEARERLGTAQRFAFRECLVSEKEKLVLKGTLGDREVVLKLPVGASAIRGETTNARLLGVIGSEPRLAGLAPRPMVDGSFQNLRYFLESAAAGDPLSASIRSMDRAGVATMVGDLLERLQSTSAEPATMAKTDECYQALIAEPVAKLLAIGVDTGIVERIESELGGALAAGRWRLGLQHGDCSNSNVFVAEGRVSGLIDWEYALERGLPALDAIGHLESTERRLSGSDACSNLRRLARWQWSCRAELDMLERTYRGLGIDPAAHAVLCRLAWLQALGAKLGTTERFEPRFVERWVHPMIAPRGAAGAAWVAD